jgi:hypothetical protein
LAALNLAHHLHADPQAVDEVLRRDTLRLSPWADFVRISQPDLSFQDQTNPSAIRLIR